LFSATCGSARTALAGSLAGTGGISISPAPRLPLADRPPVERLLRLPVLLVPVLPVLLVPVPELPVPVVPVAVLPVAAPLAPLGPPTYAGAIPQTLQ